MKEEKDWKTKCEGCKGLCRIEGWDKCYDLCTCKCHDIMDHMFKPSISDHSICSTCGVAEVGIYGIHIK